MNYLTAHATDIGIQKQTNQDALMIKTADTTKGKIGFFVVCDGMGGLSSGELASATAIQAMSNWFHQTLPSLLTHTDDFEEQIISCLRNEISEVNDEILSYGNQQGIQLGTTLTAILLIDSNYYTFQVGDSRAYVIDEVLHQLTEDQSFVARELARGNITREEASIHPQRSVLLQCIGAREAIDVVITSGIVRTNTMFLLCTDGFYHEISDEEILQSLDPREDHTEEKMYASIVELIECVKQRNETDNISAILLKVI